MRRPANDRLKRRTYEDAWDHEVRGGMNFLAALAIGIVIAGVGWLLF